jgi:hypothetical protein
MKSVRIPKVNKKHAALQELVRKVREEVERRHGVNLTFEERRDAAAAIMADTLWLDEEGDLQDLATDDDEIDVDGERYRRLEQPSSAVYYGRWGGHRIAEPLYRKVGVHNGPTLKALEVRVGIVEHLTPDFARIVGELGARSSSRVVVDILAAVGLVAPSRAFLEHRLTLLATDVADDAERLEALARTSQGVPAGAASMTCGMDRMAVRMAEPVQDETLTRPVREEPYQRTPPPPKVFCYRMAWVGSATVYDEAGKPLHTWRHASDAATDPDEIASRVVADVAAVVKEHPGIDVACIQDGAPEVDVLPRRLREVLPATTNVNELTDIKHTMGYLENVVDACEPEGDRKNCKAWYWSRLLHDDDAINRIVIKLQRQARNIDEEATEEHAAIAAALTYIQKRTHKMHYATRRAADLTIGSGDTENTCWQMQDRVTRPAQAWAPDGGLRGILAIRGLVLSGIWRAACRHFVWSRKKAVMAAA